MTFVVSLEKETLIFSAAHFITFADSSGHVVCESMHGHNYRVAAEVEGSLDDHGCVIDFIWLRDTLKSITGELDHRVLLPAHHPRIDVTLENGEVTARFDDRRWLLPEQDVRVLPLDNTSAERLAGYIGGRLIEALQQTGPGTDRLTRLSVGVDENEGQWGRWESRL